MFSYCREIESPANTGVKALAKLHSRRARRKIGRMLIDGVRPVLVALRSGHEIDAIYACPELLNCDDAEVVSLVEEANRKHVRVIRVSRAVAEKIACRENGDGIIAESAILQRPLESLSLVESPLLLLIEGVEKPGNLGAMLRTADGAGVDGVIVCDPVTDLSNPNVVRASMGTVFSMPIAVSDAVEVRKWTLARGIGVVTATPEATASYWDVDLTGPRAIAVGAEHAGLSELWRSDGEGILPVSIPMRGQADSLNVSAAAALLIYEALRQRR